MIAGWTGTLSAGCWARSSCSRRPLPRAPVTGAAPSRTWGSRWLTSATSARSCAAPAATTPSYASRTIREATSSTCGASAICTSGGSLDPTSHRRREEEPAPLFQHLSRSRLHGVGGLDEEGRVPGGEGQPFIVRFVLRWLGYAPGAALPYSGRRVGQ